MGTGIQYWFFGDEHDPATNAPTTAATQTSSSAAPANTPIFNWRDRQFSAGTDQTLVFKTQLPANYSSGGTLGVSWHSTNTTGNVVFKTSYLLVHPSSESSPTVISAAVFTTASATAAIAVPPTAGAVKQTTIDLGFSGAHANDLVYVMFGRDADLAGDTATAVTKLVEPIYLSFTTI